MSAHTTKLSAPTGGKGMRWTGLGGMSVTQHKAIAVRKHKGPTSAEQIHGSPLLLAAPSPAGGKMIKFTRWSQWHQLPASGA